MWRIRNGLAAVAVALTALTPAQVAAQAEGGDRFRLGGDLFAAGRTVEIAGEGLRAVFAIGASLRQRDAAAGNVHLSGRRIAVEAPVGGDLYAAGMDVTVSAPVDGDATVMGYDVTVAGAVAGNLRAGATNVTIAAPVAGSVLLGGDAVVIDAPIAGDAAISANSLRFGPEGRVEGTLRLYEREPGRLTLPVGAAAPDRVERIAQEDWDAARDAWSRDAPGARGWLAAALAVLGSMLAVAVVAGAAAGLAPRGMAALRETLVARPLGTFGWGFLTLSALIGGAVVSALTLIGLPLAPAALLLAGIGAAAGYVAAAFALGAGLFARFGAGEPDSFGERALAALIGAVAAGVLTLIPFLGWLILLTFALTGLGALTLRLFRPAFGAAG